VEGVVLAGVGEVLGWALERWIRARGRWIRGVLSTRWDWIRLRIASYSWPLSSLNMSSLDMNP
jgi:hypothetical protein